MTTTPAIPSPIMTFQANKDVLHSGFGTLPLVLAFSDREDDIVHRIMLSDVLSSPSLLFRLFGVLVGKRETGFAEKARRELGVESMCADAGREFLVCYVGGKKYLLDRPSGGLTADAARKFCEGVLAGTVEEYMASDGPSSTIDGAHAPTHPPTAPALFGVATPLSPPTETWDAPAAVAVPSAVAEDPLRHSQTTPGSVGVPPRAASPTSAAVTKKSRSFEGFVDGYVEDLKTFLVRHALRIVPMKAAMVHFRAKRFVECLKALASVRDDAFADAAILKLWFMSECDHSLGIRLNPVPQRLNEAVRMCVEVFNSNRMASLSFEVCVVTILAIRLLVPDVSLLMEQSELPKAGEGPMFWRLAAPMIGFGQAAHGHRVGDVSTKALILAHQWVFQGTCSAFSSFFRMSRGDLSRMSTFSRFCLDQVQLGVHLRSGIPVLVDTYWQSLPGDCPSLLHDSGLAYKALGALNPDTPGTLLLASTDLVALSQKYPIGGQSVVWVQRFIQDAQQYISLAFPRWKPVYAALKTCDAKHYLAAFIANRIQPDDVREEDLGFVQELPLRRAIARAFRPSSRLPAGVPAAAAVAASRVRMTLRCAAAHMSWKFLQNDAVGLDSHRWDLLFDHSRDLCYCRFCVRSRGEAKMVTKTTNGELHGVPIGWTRFGVSVSDVDRARECFAKWHVAFHGTKPRSAATILKSGAQLLLPGDMTQGGDMLAVPDGHIKDPLWAKRVFMSKSVLYASNTIYSKPCAVRGVGKFQVMFEVRVKPGAYDVHPETIGARAMGIVVDSSFSNLELEWATLRRNVVVITGLLVRKI